MRARFAAAVVLAVVWCSASEGQAPPAVSAADVAALQGTWVLDLERSGLTESSAERRVISNDATSMRVDVHRARDARPFTLVYKFDGSANTTPFGDGTAVSSLRREGTGFLTETVYTVNERPVTVREVLPSALHGSELAIEVMVRVEHGYEVVTPTLDSGAPNAAKAIKYFQKQP
jgi:hypothetical protein